MVKIPKTAKTSKEAWDIQESYKDQPHGWVQWKGTDVCMDVHCKCGELTHADGNFCYHVKCGACGTVYMVNGHVEFIEVKEPSQEDLTIESITDGDLANE